MAIPESRQRRLDLIATALLEARHQHLPGVAADLPEPGAGAAGHPPPVKIGQRRRDGRAVETERVGNVGLRGRAGHQIEIRVHPARVGLQSPARSELAEEIDEATHGRRQAGRGHALRGPCSPPASSDTSGCSESDGSASSAFAPISPIDIGPPARWLRIRQRGLRDCHPGVVTRGSSPNKEAIGTQRAARPGGSHTGQSTWRLFGRRAPPRGTSQSLTGKGESLHGELVEP